MIDRSKVTIIKSEKNEIPKSNTYNTYQEVTRSKSSLCNSVLFVTSALAYGMVSLVHSCFDR